MTKKKKGLFLLLTAFAGLFAAKKAKAKKDEEDLWSEATASTDPR
ncbi:MAG TPA: DLW-39 family protein [Mycobacteriales bacterium]|nr:DLW-39 family protein [Mycobacteriales bacterium]